MLLNSLSKFLISGACQGSYVLRVIIRYIVYGRLCIPYSASVFHTLTPVILTAAHEGRYDDPHFTSEETGAWSGCT